MLANPPSLLRSLETALWLFGLVCVSTFGVSKIHTARANSDAISDLEMQWRQESAPEPDQTLWSIERIAHYESARSASDTPSPLALLTIQSLGIRVAVFDGTSDQVLNLGVGRVRGTGRVGAQGNLALAGHRDGFFRGLKDIKVGDHISVQHSSGIDHYSVTELQLVKPDAVHVLQPTEQNSLTLVTCYPFYFVGPAPERFIVRAVAMREDVNLQQL